MPYVQRTVIAGDTMEFKKYHSSRIHTTGIARSPNCGHSSEAQKKVNDRRAEETIRWDIETNFRKGDLHVVLHYADKERTLEQAEEDLAKFKRQLRQDCKKAGIELKYISCTETKRMTNIHHHLIMNKIELSLIENAWEKIVGIGGVSVRPLDSRKNHAKLASYLVKESKSTETRRDEEEPVKRKKRFSKSRNLKKPKISYQIVAASSWRKDPRPHKGYELVKLEDGSFTKTGFHEISGYPYQEYFEVKRE